MEHDRYTQRTPSEAEIAHQERNRQQYVRENTLDFAIKMHGTNSTANDVLATAKMFYAFIQGDTE